MPCRRTSQHNHYLQQYMVRHLTKVVCQKLANDRRLDRPVAKLPARRIQKQHWASLSHLGTQEIQVRVFAQLLNPVELEVLF